VAVVAVVAVAVVLAVVLAVVVVIFQFNKINFLKKYRSLRAQRPITKLSQQTLHKHTTNHKTKNQQKLNLWLHMEDDLAA
jgi:hypothetical protein